MGVYSGKTVLVCGGGGLLGQSLIRLLLADGAKVKATEHYSGRGRIEPSVAKQCEVARIDLSYATPLNNGFVRLVHGVDVVFWCAAKVGGAKAIREHPSDLIVYNLAMTANFMNVAAGKVPHFGFVSSSYIYPDFGLPNVEMEGFMADPPPIHYGLGWIKRYMETLCRHFELTSSTKFSIIRPTNYYGPWDNFDPEASHVIPALIRKAVEKQDPFEIWGDGTEQRCFTYVDDVARGLMAVVAHRIRTGEDLSPLNICVKEVNTVNDVANALFNILNFRPQIVNRPDLPTAIDYKVSDPSRARDLLGFECTTSLHEGLLKTVQWYQARRGDSS